MFTEECGTNKLCFVSFVKKSNKNSSVKLINHISQLLKEMLYWLFYFNCNQLRTLTEIQFIRQLLRKLLILAVNKRGSVRIT